MQPLRGYVKRKIIHSAKLLSLSACALTAAVWISTYFGSFRANGFIPSKREGIYRQISWGVSTYRGEIGIDLGQLLVPLEKLSATDLRTLERGIPASKVYRRWDPPFDYKPEGSSTWSELGFASPRAVRRVAMHNTA